MKLIVNSYPDNRTSFKGINALAIKKDRPVRNLYRSVISSMEIETPYSIKKMAQKFGKEQNLALYAMKKLTDFASLQRVFDISQIHSPFVFNRNIGLNDFLCYLEDKVSATSARSKSDKLFRGTGYFQKYHNFMEIIKKAFGGSERKYLIVDNSTLERLENIHKTDNESFNKYIKNIKFVILDGYNSGITPFDEQSALMHRARKILLRAKQLVKSENHPKIKDMRAAIDYAVNEKTIKRLNDMGITNFKIQKYYKKSKASLSKQISDNLAPIFPKYSKFKKRINKHSQTENMRDRICEFIEATAKIYSPKTLAKAYKNLYKDILKECQCPPNEIIYYIPKANKSYVAAMLQFKTVNKIPAKQITYELNTIPENKTVVIIDDMLISGQSAAANYVNAKKKTPPNTRLILVHVLNNKANLDIENESISKRHKKYYSKRLIKMFKDKILAGKHATFLNEAEPPHFVIYSGYHEGYESICFPYMSPDNNNRFFDCYLSELFLPRQ